MTGALPSIRMVALLLSLMIAATDAVPASAPTPSRRPALPAPDAELTLEWRDLLPDNELGRPGTDSTPVHGYLGEEAPGAQQQGSAAVRAELANRRVRIPGFVVPLSLDAQGQVTDFLLVPFFGACIHVPPPPPNQIVYVHLVQGFRLESLYDPVWISGRLRMAGQSSKLGDAAYSMDADRPAPFAP